MSFSVTSGDRKLLLTAGAVSLLLTVLGVVLAPGAGETADDPSTYSVGSGGAKAAYLLLTASGYSVRRWEESVVALPTDAPSTLVLAEPEGAPTADERGAVARFIERGGRVIATGMSGAFFLPERGAVADPVSGATWARVSSRSPSSVTRAAPEITLAPRAYWDSEVFSLPLYGDDDKVRVVKYDRGRGEVLWWASATPLTNAGLREPGNLEFFLAILGDPRRPILWDEYFHGHRRTAAAPLRGAAALKGTGVQLILLVAAVLVTYARRSGPVMSPARDSRLSPLEFVRTLGGLYQRAGAASVAVDIASQRFRYQLARRLGKPGNAPVDDLVGGLRDRWNVDDPALGDLLRACEAARGDATLKPDAALELTRSLSDQTTKLDAL